MTFNEEIILTKKQDKFSKSELGNLNEIKKSCEKLITETQNDIEFFRNEQQHLQNQIQDIIAENNVINSRLEVLKNATTFSNVETNADSKDDAFRILKQQIGYLLQENADLKSLKKSYQKAVENLENENQNYRNLLFRPTSACEVNHKYSTAIKLLESSIEQQKFELKEQSATIENLLKLKRDLSDRIQNTEKLLKEKSTELEKFAGKTETVDKLQKQLSETECHNKELQNSIKIFRYVIEKWFKQEKSTLKKVQDAISIAEAAVADKEEALKREKVVKEECDNIASTIGHVMDEAARKVESDMETIKNRYIQKERVLTEEKNRLSQEIQSQQHFIQILDTRCQRFQQRYTEVKKDNDNLLVQLDQIAKTLWDFEGKIKQLENQNNGENVHKTSFDQDYKIQQFVKQNRLLNESYNVTINELTENFKKEIYELQKELTRLKAENEALKLQQNI